MKDNLNVLVFIIILFFFSQVLKMGVDKLLDYLDSGKIKGSCVNVNLTQLGHSVSQQLSKKMVIRKVHQNLNQMQISKAQFCLLVDAECCLDRLYGGYYSGKYL